MKKNKVICRACNKQCDSYRELLHHVCIPNKPKWSMEKLGRNTTERKSLTIIQKKREKELERLRDLEYKEMINQELERSIIKTK